MKRKPKTVVARNPFVALAILRKAGSHRKSEKALRRAQKVKVFREVSLVGPKQSTFNRQTVSPNLTPPTRALLKM